MNELDQSTNYPECEEVLDKMVNQLTEMSSRALNKASSIRKGGTSERPLWWTGELKALRASSRRAFNQARKNNGDSAWNIYREKLRLYKAAN